MKTYFALANPLFTASGLATNSFNGLHLESNFLAALLAGRKHLPVGRIIK